MAIDLSKCVIHGTMVMSQFRYSCTGSHDYHKHGMPLIYAPITIGVVGAMSVATREEGR